MAFADHCSHAAVFLREPAIAAEIVHIDIRDRLSAAGRATAVMTMTILAISFVTQAWLARQLGREGFGEYHATLLFVGVVATGVLLGVPLSVGQRLASADERGHHASARLTIATGLTLSGALSIVGVATVFATWPSVARLVDLSDPADVSMVAAAVVAAVLASLAGQVVLARLQFARLTAMAAAQPLVTGLGLTGVAFGLPLSGSTIGTLGFVGSGVAAVWILWSEGTWPQADGAELRGILRGVGPATAFLYPTMLTAWVDRAIIGIVVGPSALGAFVAASALVEALQRITRSIGSLSVPAYARLAAGEAGATRVLDSHVRLLAALYILAGVVFIAAGSSILTLIFGSGFGIAGTTLRLLAIALVPAGLALALASHAFGTDPLGRSARVMALLLPMQIVTALVFTSIFSIAGTALSNLIVWSIGVLLYIRTARREGASLPARTLLHIAGVSVPLFVGAWFISLQPLGLAVQTALALGLAMPFVATIVIREPERRLIGRLLSRPIVRHPA